MGGGLVRMKYSFGKHKNAPVLKEEKERICLSENILTFECCLRICSTEL